tara:strand:+ start:362 stop:565 length:204 start_codon:yes stop_codon:yes gene_type:complete
MRYEIEISLNYTSANILLNDSNFSGSCKKYYINAEDEKDLFIKLNKFKGDNCIYEDEILNIRREVRR